MSCLVEHFSNYATLNDNERQTLDRIEEGSVAVASGERLVVQHERNDRCFVLAEGWALANHQLADGSRQILDVYVPGDIMALRESAFHQAAVSITMATDGVVCEWRQEKIPELLKGSEKLGSILLTMSMIRETTILDRLISIGRMSARQRIARFILAIEQRLKITTDTSATWKMPLTGIDFADALGLSAVHFSRSKTQLRKDRIVNIERGHVRILDRTQLEAIAGYRDDFFKPDTAWIPNGKPL